jgi:hypothetical protein
MCAMPDSDMAPAIRESSQADFSHGLFDFCTASTVRKGQNRRVRNLPEGMVAPGATVAFRLRPVSSAYRPFLSPFSKGNLGSRNYGDRDKGLAPLSLSESR